jgi:CRP-like cAMP-binding protein
MGFPDTFGSGRKVATFHKKQTIFAQGDAARSVFYILAGKVSHTVVSRFGKEATLGIFGKGEFFGFFGLAGLPLRIDSATAMTECKLLQLDKEETMLELDKEGAFLGLFVKSLVARSIRNQEDLVEQLFDSCEI